MTIGFPYKDVPPLTIDPSLEVTFFDLPVLPVDRVSGHRSVTTIVNDALRHPVGSLKLSDLARGKESVLIAVDDNSRPTPVSRFVGCVLEELASAEIAASQITFIMALGTHRPMTQAEMAGKLGQSVVERFTCLNHDWSSPDDLVYLGDTAHGVPVCVNRRVTESDLVIGIGAIMPIDICGFTGGGKILVPGLSGAQTVDGMHWGRVHLDDDQVLGRPDNSVRLSIDDLARKAGLDFIVNVVLDAQNDVVYAVAGDMVAAHREGCARAASAYAVQYEREYDVVVADSHPFDIEFWQANKALGAAGRFVRRGGVIILVTPCYEGWSRTHSDEILRIGYPPTGTIRELVEAGHIRHKVVGVHMHQVSSVAVDRANLVVVSDGLPRTEIEAAGFHYAATPQAALARAVDLVGHPSPRVAVLSNASRMLPRRVEPKESE